MATPEVLQREQDVLPSSSLFDPPKGEKLQSRGMLIEKKIEFLESLTAGVSNRRSRRWLNERLLMELVPRLNAEEIRGLFAPPPWGDDVPPSPFCMTKGGDWDKFRNTDMDKELGIDAIFFEVMDFLPVDAFLSLASMIEALESSSSKRRGRANADKMAVLNAWHRVDCRTREALRRSFLSELIEGYEECLLAFIKESEDGDVLVLHVQDPFHRLLLHGVCEFYNLVSVTVTQLKEAESSKMTRIKKKEAESSKMTRIKKKKMGSGKLPNITLSHFLKMSKEGVW